MNRHIATKEEIEYLKEIAPGRYKTEIQKMMFEKFGVNLTIIQIKNLMSHNNIRSGVDCRFKKGIIQYRNCKATSASWQKGHIPANTCELFTERKLIRDKYIRIKIAEPDKWELKHRYIYEQHYGKIQKDEIVIFLNNNKEDFRIENLMVITKRENLIMNRFGLRKDDAEETKAGILLAKLIIMINDKKKELKNVYK